MTYEFHPEAEAEFIEAAAYYERNVPGLGERFGNEVRRTIELLLEYPELGLLIDANLRKVILSRFPYYLIYLRPVTGCCGSSCTSSTWLLAI